MESGAFSMESSGTMLAETELPGAGHDESAVDQQSDSETEPSEDASAVLANNPFTLAGSSLVCVDNPTACERKISKL